MIQTITASILYKCLYLQVEKVLQHGDISEAAEPYYRAKDIDSKAKKKLRSNASFYCTTLGKYRMPFAWTAINVLELLAGNQV